MGVLTGPCTVAEKQQFYFEKKMSTFFYFFKLEKIMYGLPLIVCLSCSFIFQILQAYCFLTLVRSRMLTSNEVGGVEP